MAKYLVVTEADLTTPMRLSALSLMEQMGMLKEECHFISVLDGEKPEGSRQKVTAPQLGRLLPEFRKRLGTYEAEGLIMMGPGVVRAITGRTGKGWGIDKIGGYILNPDHCQNIPIRTWTKIGVYKTTNKVKGYKLGEDRFAWRKVPSRPVLPKGCDWMVACIAIKTVLDARFKNVAAFRAAIGNAVRFANGEPLVTSGFEYINGPPDLGLDWSGVVSYDLEAAFDSTVIERASLSSAQGTWTFEWDALGKAAFLEAMAGKGLKVAQNQQFDIPILNHHKVDVPEPHFDTMLAGGLLEPDLPKSLDALVPRHLLMFPWKHMSVEKGFADPQYSALDAFITRELALKQQEELVRLRMDSLFQDRMMPCVPVLTSMKVEGMKLDVPAVEKWCSLLTDNLAAAIKEWTTKHPTVQVSKVQQLKDLLYGKGTDQWGLKVKRNRGDGITTDVKALTTLMSESPAHASDLRLIVRIRKLQKDLSTYGKTALGFDRVHPGYLPAGKDTTTSHGKGMAATGRLACSRPNLQNQTPESRVLYIPDFRSSVFIEFDWAQAELRVAAALSGDKALQAALDSSDFHAVTAALVGCPRPLAKTIIYATAYGAGPVTICNNLRAQGIETTPAECREVQNGIFAAYVDWAAWRQLIIAQVTSQNYLRNPFDRIRNYPEGKKEVTSALDFPPQSIVGDMGWSLYRPMHDLACGLGGRLTTVCHDSFLPQVPFASVEEMVRRGTDLMETRFHEVAPEFFIPSTVKVGKPGASWGHLKEVT